ncbi:hypothetical protein HMI56_005903, partial [Coelomomyces lativittatus]
NLPQYPTIVPLDSPGQAPPNETTPSVAQSPHVPIYASPPWMYVPQPAYSYPQIAMSPGYVSNPYYPIYPSSSRSMAVIKNPGPPTPIGPSPINRYYILKSLSLDDLELSIRNRVWSPQLHLESLLDQAFK